MFEARKFGIFPNTQIEGLALVLNKNPCAELDDFVVFQMFVCVYYENVN